MVFARPILFIAFFVANIGVANAFPTVRVRSESSLSVRIERDPEARAIINLLDDLGAPIAYREVTLTALTAHGDTSGAIERARTDAYGSAQAALVLPRDAATLVISFAGDDLYDRTEKTLPIDDIAPTLTLEIGAPSTVRLGTRAVAVTVTLSGPSTLFHEIELTLQDELGREFARRVTAINRRDEIQVSPGDFGGPGEGELVVIARHEGRIVGRAAKPLTRVAPTTTHASFVSDNMSLRVHGSIIRFDRTPIGRAAVSVRCGRGVIATLTANDEGLFAAEIPRDVLAETCQIEAQFEPSAAWLESSRAIGPSIHAQRRMSMPLIAAALATVAFLAFNVWRLRRRVHVTPPKRGDTNIDYGKPRSILADQRAVSVLVLDARTGEPLPNAIVTRTTDASAIATTDASGRAAFELGAGRHALQIASIDHAPATLQITSPHRGEWRATIVRLDNLRSRALDALRRVEPGFPNVTATPREIAQKLRGSPLHVHEGAALLLTIETLAYSQTQIDLDELIRLERAVSDWRASHENASALTHQAASR